MDDLRKVNHPTLFLFLGDHSLEAVKHVFELNETIWSNHKNIQYFYLGFEGAYEKENVVSFHLSKPSADESQYRKTIKDDFYQAKSKLVQLNESLRLIRKQLAQGSKHYSEPNQLTISIITMVDDPVNIILPEIALLTKHIMSESFNHIQSELFALLQDVSDHSNHHLLTAMGISFLKELRFYQRDDYTYSGKLEISSDEQIEMEVTHYPSRLFSPVYLLSERDERGVTHEKGMETIYEIISNINLLKSAETIQSDPFDLQKYNHKDFLNRIQSNGNVYASAGFSKVIRPRSTIAITVLYHTFHHLLERITSPVHTINQKRTAVLELLGLDKQTVENIVNRMIPPGFLERMTGFISEDISFEYVKSSSMREAEQVLHGKGCEATFAYHFSEPAYEAYEQMNVKEEMETIIRKKIIDNHELGVYCAYHWTSENSDNNGIMTDIRTEIKSTMNELKLSKDMLEDYYRDRVENEGFKQSSRASKEKENLANFTNHLVHKIYGKKLEILRLELKLNYLKEAEASLVSLHSQYRQWVEQMEELKDLLYQMTHNAIELETDYLSRNIFQYYGNMVAEIVQGIQASKGDQFYFEDRYFGNIGQLIAQGIENMLEKLIQVVLKEILPNRRFYKTIEEELLERANMDVKFTDSEVLTMNGLFRELYKRLEDYANIHIELVGIPQYSSHTEKYFFGDFNSEFLHWAFEYDKNDRTYVLGCVHEENSNGIEKLNLMGGFDITDLRYYNIYNKNYNHYRQIGFHFHGIEPQLLEDIHK